MPDSKVLSISLVLTIGLFSACKEGFFSKQEEKIVTISPGSPAIASVDEVASVEEFFPLIWKEAYELNLGSLPTDGESERIPYSGWWYPFDHGGTNIDIYGDGMSPLEKYDRAFRPSGSAATWESRHHSMGESWFGHCNGFAASAQRHVEPTKDVTVDGILFRPHDVKALLAEIHMKAIPVFIGGRRCRQALSGPPTDRPNPQTMGPCEDVNPGVFHAGLANIIGRKKHIMIMDLAIHNEVWNYPVFRYQSSVEPISEEDASALVNGQAGDYPFNRNATHFYEAKTTVFYREFADREGIYGDQGFVVPAVFQYVLEADSNGKILGGEWIGNSKTRHPDFIWLSLQPLKFQSNQINENEDSPVNPFLDPDKVIRLWAESAGFDPDNPPLDIMEPTDAELKAWGRFTKFKVTLDGNDRGLAFVGKPVHLVLTREDSLKGEFNFTVAMDGMEPQSRVVAEGEHSAFVAFEPKPGIQSLSLSLYRNGGNLAEEIVLVHGLP